MNKKLVYSNETVNLIKKIAETSDITELNNIIKSLESDILKPEKLSFKNKKTIFSSESSLQYADLIRSLEEENPDNESQQEKTNKIKLWIAAKAKQTKEIILAPINKLKNLFNKDITLPEEEMDLYSFTKDFCEKSLESIQDDNEIQTLMTDMSLAKNGKDKTFKLIMPKIYEKIYENKKPVKVKTTLQQAMKYDSNIVKSKDIKKRLVIIEKSLEGAVFFLKHAQEAITKLENEKVEVPGANDLNIEFFKLTQDLQKETIEVFNNYIEQLKMILSYK